MKPSSPTTTSVASKPVRPVDRRLNMIYAGVLLIAFIIAVKVAFPMHRMTPAESAAYNARAAHERECTAKLQDTAPPDPSKCGVGFSAIRP